MGDAGDGSGLAWVLEVLLQVIVRAGKVPPRRAWLVVVGPPEVFLRPILPGRCGLWCVVFPVILGDLWAFTCGGVPSGILLPKLGTNVGPS